MRTNRMIAAMKAAIKEAAQSQGEDDRHHPMVGAVVTDEAGKILLRAHRGMDGSGGHAEFLIFRELDKRPELDRSKLVLFVTLEPCSRRSERKTPCAVRVAESGIRTVYVGSLDPNPQIIGRGVNHLISEGLTVEHFPADLRAQLLEMNATFQGTHSYLVDPVVVRDDEESPRQRAGILASTLDLIATAPSSVLIHAGDASWLPKIFVGLVEARCRGVRVRLVARKSAAPKILQWAEHIGVEVVETAADTGLRATLAVSDEGPQGLIVVEDRPSRHALTFSAPHEASTLDLVAQHFEQSWRRGVARPHTGLMPNIVPIPLDDLFSTLRSNVRQYAKAEFSMVDLRPAEIARLTNEVEIFKLRRVASTLRILDLCGRDEPLSIEGTPWGLFPPIVEQDASGAYTLIDGVHRLFMSSQRETIPVVLVGNVSAPLPAKPTRDAPRIVAGRSPRDERYNEYSGVNFRDIKKALERGAWASV